MILCVAAATVFVANSRADEPTLVPELQFDSAAKSDAPSNFYAAGKLQRVRRKDNGSERLALTDSDGKIVAFLAPTARVDFRSHLGAEIAVKARILNSDDDGSPYVSVDSITRIGNERDESLSQGAVGSGVRQATYQEDGSIPADAVVTYDGPVGNAPPMSQRQVYPAGAAEPIRTAQVPQGSMGPGTIVEGPSMGPGEFIPEGGLVSEPWSQDGMHVGHDCANCGGCGEISEGIPCPTCQPLGCAPCGPPGWLWIRGEYLNWWADGMDIPPLLITSTQQFPGDVGRDTDATARVLYGDEEILDGGRSGFRLSFGGWFGPERHWGFEGEFLEVGDLSENFSVSSNGSGSPILARPFFDINPRDEQGNLNPPATNNVQLVAFPDVVAGTFDVDSFSRLRAAAGRLRFNICCKQCRQCVNRCTCGACGGGYGGYGGGAYGCGYPPFIKVDFTGGYRHGELREGITIREDLQSLTGLGRFEISDSFLTRNSFHGGEVGTAIEMGRNRWTLDMLMRLALGGVKQEVEIAGQTRLTPTTGSPIETFTGGVLAQTSNIGTYSRNEFAVIPELNANLGFYLTPRLRTIVGYTFFYFSNVLRPGDQIDLDVNPDLIPPQGNVVGLARPGFEFRETSYWAQGINVGLDFRW
jgi:Putative beta barrel porin-7 (BBP7)